MFLRVLKILCSHSTGGRRTPEETPTQQLDLSNHGGPDAVTVGVLDSLDSTKPHRFAVGMLEWELIPTYRSAIRRPRAEHGSTSGMSFLGCGPRRGPLG